jgi:hypothetical protein
MAGNLQEINPASTAVAKDDLVIPVSLLMSSLSICHKRLF